MNIEPIKLLRGSHKKTGNTGRGCVMNVVAYLNGEQVITDESECVCVTVRPMAIFLNDLADDEQRQRMLPLVLRMMESATGDKSEISRRLTLLVEFANWQAGLAAESTPKYAAESAKYAKYATKYAAESAKYAKYAESAADNAVEYAKYAAKYAAESAKYADEYKTVTFDRGLELLDAMLPPAEEPAPVVRERAEQLVRMNSIAMKETT